MLIAAPNTLISINGSQALEGAGMYFAILFLVFTGLFAWQYMSSPAGYRLRARGRPA